MDACSITRFNSSWLAVVEGELTKKTKEKITSLARPQGKQSECQLFDQILMPSGAQILSNEAVLCEKYEGGDISHVSLFENIN